MSRIIISGPDGKRGVLELTKPLVSIGRASVNDLVLQDSSVSRLHAVIKIQNGKAFIADRDSTNGIIIDGQRIDNRQLRDNDVAKLGTYELRYEEVRDSGILIKSADLLSNLNKVLRRGRSDEIASQVAGQVPSELTQQIQRLERENQLLSMLYDAGKALSSRLALNDISEQVMNLAFRIEGVERGFMMLFDEDGNVARQSEVRYRQPMINGAMQPPFIMSNAIRERIRREQKPILVTDADTDERFTGSESMRINGLRSAMCAPLLGRDKLFGILYVDNLERPHAFTQHEWNIFALLATQAGAAIDTLAAHEQIAQQVTERAALERFLSPEVVGLVVEDPKKNVRLGGVNKKVSVLFADIRGFTALSEKMQPKKVVGILNHYFTHVTEIIFDYGGTLDKFLGDGVMAVFGAPVRKGNHAKNAVLAAQAIQRLVTELNRDCEERQWPEIRVGIGINTGFVTAGNIGSPRRIDYTVIGDTVNTASRLMSSAKSGKIIISEHTAAKLAAHEFPLRALAPLRVKGKSKPVRCFSVEWRRAKAAGR